MDTCREKSPRVQKLWGGGWGLSLRLEVNAEWPQGAVPLDAAGPECGGAWAGRCGGRDRSSSSGCLSAGGGWEMVSWLGLRAQLGLALAGPLKNDAFGRSWRPCSSLLMDSAPGPFETIQAAFGDNWKRLHLPICWDKCHGPLRAHHPCNGSTSVWQPGCTFGLSHCWVHLWALDSPSSQTSPGKGGEVFLPFK